jgi:hypothetical protein
MHWCGTGAIACQGSDRRLVEFRGTRKPPGLAPCSRPLRLVHVGNRSSAPAIPCADRSVGLQYTTVGLYRVKLNMSAKDEADFFTGLGYWTRANPEQCLLATRGKPPRRAKDVRRLVVERRREHSRKPDVVRDRIERLVDGPYLELFARETKLGWDCWGDQADLFDNGRRPARRQPSKLTDAVQARLSDTGQPDRVATLENCRWTATDLTADLPTRRGEGVIRPTAMTAARNARPMPAAQTWCRSSQGDRPPPGWSLNRKARRGKPF